MDPADRRSALVLAWLMVLLSTATKLGDGVVQALFLERVGAAFLPGLFAVNALVDVAAGALYLRFGRGKAHGTFFRALLVATALGSVAMRGLALTGHPAAFFTIHAVHEAASMIVTLHWGTFLLDFFPQSRTASAFPIVYAGARLGGILGGLALRQLAGPSLADLLLLVAAVQIVAALFVHQLSARAPAVLSADARAGLAGEIRASLETARGSPLLRAMAAATAMMVLVRLLLRTLSGEALSASMGESELARFLGSYLVAANAAGFALQVFVMPRLIGRIGVSGANLAYATISLVAFGALGLSYGVGTAAAARLVDAELKDSMKTPLSALFYGGLPPAERARGRAFILGLVIPIASIAFGVALQALPAKSPGVLVAIGLPSACAFVVTTWLQNRGYQASLRSRMRAAQAGSAEADDLHRALEVA